MTYPNGRYARTLQIVRERVYEVSSAQMGNTFSWREAWDQACLDLATETADPFYLNHLL